MKDLIAFPRLVISIGVTLTLLLPAHSVRAEVTVEVGVANPSEISLEGSGAEIPVKVRDGGLPPKVEAVVTVRSLNPNRVLPVQESVRTANGDAKVRVRPVASSGVATLVIGVGQKEEKVFVLVRDPYWQFDVARLLTVVAGFILLVWLVSIGTEKITDLFKEWFPANWRPKAAVKTLPGADYVTLAGKDPPTLFAICTVAGVPTNKTTAGQPDKNVLMDEIRATDEQRAVDENRWALIWRVVSVIVGFGIAWALNLDAFQLLKPLLNGRVTELDPRAGYLLTGFASSLGAAYWHTVLQNWSGAKDNLTKVRPIE